MRLPRDPVVGLVGRAASEDSGGGKGLSAGTEAFVAIFAVFGFFIIVLCAFLYLRSLRARQFAPRYIPGEYLKQRWRKWNPRSAYDLAGSGDDSDLPQVSLNDRASAPAAGAVDRNTSVRSVMTLPAYMSEPGATEKVLGRAGERDGIDVVVEHPETVEEEEERRDQEMGRLYQIRVARREEQAFREENRRQRHEAASRGDTARVEELHAARRERLSDSRAASNTNLPAAGTGPGNSTTSLAASTLDAEDASRTSRERRISSISYADIGLARLDGTRVRASSESEQPLLDSAASMDGRRSPSPSSLPRPPYGRHRFTNSVLSVSTNASDPASSAENRPRSDSADDAHDVISLDSSSRSPGETRRSPEEGPASGAEQSNTSSDPPDYENITLEDAPPYESPQRTDAPRLPQLSALPAIEVTGTTPVNSTPNTPASATRTDSQRL
ncbi:MAG: hypothetical protein M4579_000130 [Chaenotheca gracillima]|nr:MAG: hypothetical protein M4579_000130 [Chaenotheca gracillima]